jgi:hypothetical protein
MQLMPGTIKALTRWTPYSEEELASSIEANTVGGLAWWQMHYACYGNIAKGSSGYNGRPHGAPFPTEYGRNIAARAETLAAWVDSVDRVQLRAFSAKK